MNKAFYLPELPDNDFTSHSELPERPETGAAQINGIPVDKPCNSGQSGGTASSSLNL